MKLQREWKHKLHRKEKEWEENVVLFSVKALLLLLRTGKLISTNEDLALGTMNHFCFCFFLPFTQIWGNSQKRGHLAELVLLYVEKVNICLNPDMIQKVYFNFLIINCTKILQANQWRLLFYVELHFYDFSFKLWECFDSKQTLFKKPHCYIIGEGVFLHCIWNY